MHQITSKGLIINLVKKLNNDNIYSEIT